MSAEESDSIWPTFMEALQSLTEWLPKDWPVELPAECEAETEAFWTAACREEMTRREVISTKIRQLVNQEGCPSIDAMEGWLVRRRIEWAAQAALEKARAGMEPPVAFVKVLEWALIDSWHSAGCLAMWSHAERGGKPHEDNPDGMTPWR